MIQEMSRHDHRTIGEAKLANSEAFKGAVIGAAKVRITS